MVSCFAAPAISPPTRSKHQPSSTTYTIKQRPASRRFGSRCLYMAANNINNQSSPSSTAESSNASSSSSSSSSASLSSGSKSSSSSSSDSQVPPRVFEGVEDTLVFGIPLPLGLAFEMDRDGLPYVAEILDGGNAQKDGRIKEGDIVVAASAPIGAVLRIMPTKPSKVNAIEFLTDLVKFRDEQNRIFYLEVRRLSGGVQKVMDMISESEDEREWSEIEDLNDKIYSMPYYIPSGNIEEEDEEQGVEESVLEMYSSDDERARKILMETDNEG
eukprot:CAMPEP_0184696630 /NCGR_PEP_ID=MMETSP0313-20130426/3859_1 /TAXON_ID=2792 /ORGANISM="Porphyridium aerugineum, Strain SAG 1380-2" /LENGTH=271 /DNA_ID=CAMNT_0027155291 /DNA_START=1 /DNA_END=812 /DNA_ORIENTATION=+